MGKGTTEDRWVQDAEGKCLKDINFKHVTIHHSAEINEELHRVLQSDTQFLERLRIMDYSLILSIQEMSKDAHAAVHTTPFSKLMGGLEGMAHCDARGCKPVEECIFHIGIVDMLTTYDFKKQLAHTLKSNTIAHFCDIDTEPPDVYAERFRSYFKRKILPGRQDAKVSVVQQQAKSAPLVSAPPDLLVFDTPQTAFANASLDPAPSASGYLSQTSSARVVEDLLDLDFLGGANCKAQPSTREPSATAGMPANFDLLSFDAPADVADLLA